MSDRPPVVFAWVLASTFASTFASAAPAALKISLQLRDANVAESAPIEKALIEAIKELPSLQLVKSGGTRVLQADIARLGGGRVMYLQALEGGKPLASTTATLAGDSGDLGPVDKKQVRAAIVRVLEPGLHVGRVQLKIDVQGAVASVNGAPQAGTSFELPVGTHALRVTHPAYRDFMRFVEVAYDQTLTVDIGLAKYPLTEGEMAEKLVHQPLKPPPKRPWYRSWWALTLAGAAITGATVGIVYGARPGIGSDLTVIYAPKP
jgi:hypothetical protein